MFERVEELQRAMVALSTRVERIDIRRYESHPPGQLAIELAPVVTDVLRAGHRLVMDIERLCELGSTAGKLTSESEAPPTPYVPFEQALDAAVGRQKRWSIQSIGDIAFLAALELGQRLERLERIEGCQHHLAIIGECDGSLRRVRKALMALDQGIERAGLGKARLDYASELELSLDVRRTYAKLRARIEAVGTPAGDTFYVQLRAVATALATVVGWKGYCNLRVRDRMQMRDLQRRLIDWFRSDRNLGVGQRLWQDIDGFVSMLSEVNRRQELREHDSILVERLMTALAEDGPISPCVSAALRELEGLDREIDELLARPEVLDASAWRAPIARVHIDVRRHWQQ